MFKSLYAKLAAVLTALFCVVGLCFAAAAVFSTRLYNLEVNQRLNRDLARQILAEKSLIRDERVDRQALEEIFHVLMIINPGIEVYLLNADGKIMAFSAPEGKVKRTRVRTGPLERLLSGGAALPVSGDDPRNPEGEKIFSVARIPERGDLEGYLYVILGGEFHDSVAQALRGSHILRLSAWMVFAGMLFALAAGLILFAVLTARLKRLAGAVGDFKRDGTLKDMDIPLARDEKKTDEIDGLTAAFREMAGRIERQMEALRQSDASRRELIANISHDLRTPLSTMRSYIETVLLKESRMSPKRRHDYLENALKHCERLGRLISELTELARYESCEIQAKIEAFNPAELISDIARKYRLKAKQRGIEIVWSLPTRTPFVSGDIAMIERVIENLIENALHHTFEGGKIELELAFDERAVTVRTSNTGGGISPEDLPHIFERFYRSGKNRGADSRHSGLGLAISRKILQLHGAEITAENVPGKGAAFTFSLNRS